MRQKTDIILKKNYGFSFPESFFEFYNFYKDITKKDSEILWDSLGISLGSVFEVFNSNVSDKFNPLYESRYYKDPPEFFTILYGDTDGLHWGYYLDDPNECTLPVVSYYHNDAFCLSIDGNNIFEAVRLHLEQFYSDAEDNINYDPDCADDYKRQLGKFDIIREDIKKYYTKERIEKGEKYCNKYIKTLKRKIIAKTRDGMGIIVPKNKYKKLQSKDKFEIYNYKPDNNEVEAFFNKAMEYLENGFPGTALKLGKDLWIYNQYFVYSFRLLDRAYHALNRNLLGEILKVAKQFRDNCDKK